MWRTHFPPNKHDYYSCTRASEGNKLMTTAPNIFRGLTGTAGRWVSLFFFFRAFGPDDSCMTLVCPPVQCNSKNDFGGGISWVLIKIQAEIRSHISHLGFWWSGRWWDFSPERNLAPLISFFLALLHFLMLQRHSFKIKSSLRPTEACGRRVGGSCLMCSVGILYLLDWFITAFHVFHFFFTWFSLQVFYKTLLLLKS